MASESGGVCLICMSTFKGHGNCDTSRVDGWDGGYKVRVLSPLSGLIPPNEEEIGKGLRKDVYSRFMTFISRYLKFTANAEKFLRRAREFERKNDGMRIIAFCRECSELVQDVCDVYAELQAVKLHLIGKLESLGEAMRISRRAATSKSNRKSFLDLAEQLNIEEVKHVENFRKALRLRCASRGLEVFPIVRVPRGLFPEEWKFDRSIIQQTLVRLIFVFALGKQSFTQTHADCNQIEEIASANQENINTRKLRTRTSNKRKLERATQDDWFNSKEIKIENNSKNCYVDDSDSLLDHGDNLALSNNDDSDPDWNDGSAPASPMTPPIINSPHNSDAEGIAESEKPDAKAKGRNRRKCKYCNKLCKGMWELRRHIRGIHGRQLESQCKTNYVKSSGKQNTKKERLFMCKVCDKKFYKRARLTVHMTKIHKMDKDHTCLICKQKFKDLTELFQHTSNDHPDANQTKRSGSSKQRFKCDMCRKWFSCQAQLNLHGKNEHGVAFSRRECPVCFETFSNVIVLQRHVVAHWEVFPCYICDETFLTGTTAMEHMTSVHDSSFPCWTCGLNFTEPDKLERHMATHEDSVTNFCCMFCHLSFTNQQGFELHVKVSHVSEGSTIFCDHNQCSESFRSLADLNDHLKSYVKPTSTMPLTVPVSNQDQILVKEEKIRTITENTASEFAFYQCSTCDWNFTSEYSLTLHKLAHLEPSSYLASTVHKFHCPEADCGKMSSRSDLLISHYHFEHGKTSMRPFSCYLCGTKFDSFFIYKTHLRVHHDILSEKEFTCSECSTKFPHSLGLFTHMKTHEPGFSESTNEVSQNKTYIPGPPRMRKRPRTKEQMDKAKKAWADLNCECCGKACKSPSALRDHLTKHHESVADKKSIQCYFCYQTFAFKQTFTLHELTTHTQNNKFMCDEEICCAVFETVNELNEHLQTHLTTGNSINDQPVQSSEEMSTSPEKISSSEQAINFCKKCGWGFLNRAMLELHELYHIVPKKGIRWRLLDFNCPDEKCTEFYNSAEQMIRHYNISHGAALKRYKCVECGMEFYERKKLNFHMTKVHPNMITMDERRQKYMEKVNGVFVCLECGGKFQTRRPYEEHVKMHDPKNHMKCPNCEKTFHSKYALDCHIAKTHDKSQTTPCPTCGKLYPDQASLRVHLRSHLEPKWECKICHKRFKREFSLNRHMPQHDANRMATVVCSECGMSYKTESGLQYHMVSKHLSEEKLRYGCLYCPKRYHRFMLFKLHMKTCMKTHGIDSDDEQATAALAQPSNPGNSSSRDLSMTRPWDPDPEPGPVRYVRKKASFDELVATTEAKMKGVFLIPKRKYSQRISVKKKVFVGKISTTEKSKEEPSGQVDGMSLKSENAA